MSTTDNETRFRLKIPPDDAFAFAMGWSDLGYETATDPMRRIVGLLLVDSLDYAEEWRASAQARSFLSEKWPGCFCV